jgi:hypothetical protein
MRRDDELDQPLGLLLLLWRQEDMRLGAVQVEREQGADAAAQPRLATSDSVAARMASRVAARRSARGERVAAISVNSESRFTYSPQGAHH